MTISAIWLSFQSLLLFSQNPVPYDTYFENAVLRVDFYHGIDPCNELIVQDALVREPFYAGGKTRLINDMNLGNYQWTVTDSATGKTIFAESFSDLFEEWQSTDEAKSGVKKFFHESIRMPFPKNTVKLVMTARTKKGRTQTVYQALINPLSGRIIREQPGKKAEYSDLKIAGDPAKAVDILFVSEGYTASQRGKFDSDARKLTEMFLKYEPYASMAGRFSFRSAFVPSEESGTDEPDKGIYRRTALNSSFNTFDIARYLTTLDNKTIRDIAGSAYYDQIVIVANSSRYGGAGFYNLYSIFSSDMQYLDDVFIHEFGHQFGALGDEYEGGFTDGYYDLAVEPWEPNLTIATTRGKIKWGRLIDQATPLPTPNDETFKSAVGLFEGAGYVSKGMYRSQLFCIMRGFQTKNYCAACKDHITKVIRFYTE